MFESPSDVYSFEIDQGGVGNLTIMGPYDGEGCNEKVSQVRNIVPGKWKAGYVPSLGYVIGSEDIFNNINDVYEFDDLTNRKIVVNSQEEYNRVNKFMFEKHQEAKIAREILESKDVEDVGDIDAVFLRFDNKDYEDADEMEEFSDRQVVDAADLLSLGDLAPRMVETEKGSYIFFPKWPTTNIKYFYDVNDDLCAVVLSKTKRMNLSDIISFCGNGGQE